MLFAVITVCVLYKQDLLRLLGIPLGIFFTFVLVFPVKKKLATSHTTCSSWWKDIWVSPSFAVQPSLA